MTELEDFRQIVREEIRRDSIGARCPECGETDQGISIEEIEQRTGEDREYIWTCWSCECSGPVQIFDPLNQEHPGIYESDEGGYYHCPACTSVFDNEDDALHHVYYEEYEFIKGVVDDH